MDSCQGSDISRWLIVACGGARRMTMHLASPFAPGQAAHTVTAPEGARHGIIKAAL